MSYICVLRHKPLPATRTRDACTIRSRKLTRDANHGSAKEGLSFKLNSTVTEHIDFNHQMPVQMKAKNEIEHCIGKHLEAFKISPR